jgi:hypothetical protein
MALLDLVTDELPGMSYCTVKHHSLRPVIISVRNFSWTIPEKYFNDPVHPYQRFKFASDVTWMPLACTQSPTSAYFAYFTGFG